MLEMIDKESETIEKGRSAFIRNAVKSYLNINAQRKIDNAYRKGYSGGGAEFELDSWETEQVWPDR